MQIPFSNIRFERESLKTRKIRTGNMGYEYIGKLTNIAHVRDKRAYGDKRDVRDAFTRVIMEGTS